MNIVLLEKDLSVSEAIKKQLKEHMNDSKLTHFDDPEKFIDAVYDRESSWDAIFASTKIDDVNIISLIYELQKKIKHIPIVFITDSPGQDSQDIFLESAFFKPFALILKPVDQEVLNKIMIQLSEICSYKKSVIKIKNDKKKGLMIPSSEIIYVESDKRQLMIYSQTQNRKIYGKLKDFKEKLPDYFAIPHSSFLVNLNYIESYDSVSVTLKNKTVIPVSKSKKEDFINKLIFFQNYNLS